MSEYQLFIGGQLIQKHKDLSGLTLLNDDKVKEATGYQVWLIINPDGSKVNVERCCTKKHEPFMQRIINGPNANNYLFVSGGMLGIGNMNDMEKINQRL